MNPTIRARPYRPDNAFDARGVALLTVALLVAGGALGFAAHVASEYFYLILVFPLLIGAALGAVAAFVVQRTGMRNPWLAGLAGLLAGAFAMAMMHYFDYRTFLGVQAGLIAEDPSYAAELRASDAPVPFVDDEEAAPADNAPFSVPRPFPMPGAKAKREAAFRRYVDAIRIRSLADYIDFEARQGVTIKGSRSGETPQNLGYTGSYIYWVVEALIVAGVAFAMAYGQSRKPYCAACGRWKAERAIGFLDVDSKEIAAAVREGDVDRLRASGPTFAPTASLLHISSCPAGAACRAEPREDEVRLERRAYDRKGRIVQRKTVEHVIWPATATPAIDALFAQPIPTPPLAQ